MFDRFPQLLLIFLNPDRLDGYGKGIDRSSYHGRGQFIYSTPVEGDLVRTPVIQSDLPDPVKRDVIFVSRRTEPEGRGDEYQFLRREFGMDGGAA